ncbi:MAG: NADH-quinone oxidoreductase subunit C [Anaerolineae bacterium]|nr:NADH-quinone oxidoreductase subunit C [Anaerolineae bacterium]
MNGKSIISILCQELSLSEIEHKTIPVDDLVITLPAEQIHQAVQVLLERSEIYHLSTITGQDTGEHIELLYHFWSKHGLTLRTLLPRQSPEIHTMIDLIPGATFYEREIAEMLDVVFEWHPISEHLFLPDDWYGEAPLRKRENDG